MRTLLVVLIGFGFTAWAQAGAEVARPAVRVALLNGVAPDLQGDLTDAAWGGAVVAEANQSKDGLPLEGSMRFRVTRDTTNLYLAVECFECPENLKNLKAKATLGKPDGLYADDNVELFLDPTDKRKSYYHLIVNSKGVCKTEYFVAPRTPEKGWKSTTCQAVAKVGAASWTVEMALPFTFFNRTEKSEPEWGFNLSRYRSATNETTYWAPVFACTSHRPKKFGTLQGMPALILHPEMALPQLEVKITGAPPAITGELDADAWQTAAVSEAFRLKNGDAPQARTVCRVIRSSNTVYVAVECFENEQALQNLRCKAAADDPDSIWSDDCVEIFVDPTNQRKSYYQLSVNAKGLHFCRYFTKPRFVDALWEAPPYPVATRVGKDRWVAMLALPASLFTRTETCASTWAFNISRYQSATQELSYWSPVRASFSARPEMFGLLNGLPESVASSLQNK